MKFLLIALDPNDGRMRAFHDVVFNDHERISIEGMLEKHFAYIRQLSEALLEEKEIQPQLQQAQAMTATNPHVDAMSTQSEIARTKGFTGNTCENCGSFNMVRTGTCETCQDCQWNKGCG